MKISAISQSPVDESERRNLFIRYSNSFMSSPETEEPTDKTFAANNGKKTKMGIETLETFSIYPKEVVNGKTIITA